MIYRDFLTEAIPRQAKEEITSKRTDKIEMEFPGIGRVTRQYGTLVGGVLVADRRIGRGVRQKIATDLGTRFGISIRQDHPMRVVLVRRAPRATSSPVLLFVTTRRSEDKYEFRVKYRGGRTVVAAGGYASRSTARRRGKVVADELRGLRR